MRNRLKELFEAELNLETNLKEYVKNLTSPYTNTEDYIKYGNTFLKLEIKNDEIDPNSRSKCSE